MQVSMSYCVRELAAECHEVLKLTLGLGFWMCCCACLMGSGDAAITSRGTVNSTDELILSIYVHTVADRKQLDCVGLLDPVGLVNCELN